MKKIKIIGGGLAGCEAAYRLAANGIQVDLYEMRPNRMTPAHTTDRLGELVCSNSLKGTDPETAHGLLKTEINALGSLILDTAASTSVPAGKALAVDRERFASEISRIIETHPNIRIIREEVTEIDPDELSIIATGPLTSDSLAQAVANLTGSTRLFFYDAVAPIVDGESVDLQQAFFGSRWDPDSTDYLNCPMDELQYYRFVDALLEADRVNPHEFEDQRFFEGCLPIEVIAERGRESLRYGGMRPIGFSNPADGRRPFAILQLRRENLKGEAYNLVGFQTRLKYPEQDKVFRLIPALEKVNFLRYGSIHRNTFIDSPRVINEDLSLKDHPQIFFAGQITGVEGYVESAASGILAATAILKRMTGEDYSPPPPQSALGSLINHITDASIEMFQPMNINFGIMPMPQVHKKIRKQTRLELAAQAYEQWLGSIREK